MKNLPGKVAMATILLAAIFIPAAADQWFRSGPGGVAVEPLLPGGPDAAEWVLRIEEDDRRERRVLYHDGALSRTVILIRQAGRLAAREEYGADGRLISRISYLYDPDGIPRRALIDEAGVVSSSSAGAIQPDGAAWRETAGSGEDWRIKDHDGSGQPIRYRVVAGGEVAAETLWSRGNGGELFEEVATEGDETRRSRFDDRGRRVSETVSGKSGVILLRRYTWDGDDLVRVEERGQGGLVVRDLKWQEELLVEETITRNGRIETVTTRSDETHRIETHYRDDEPVVRIFWEGGRKTREEFLVGGKVVRIGAGRP